MSATKTVYLLKAGDVLGVYRVIRPLGAGGMGEVYLVEHQHLRKRYALKILPSDVSQDSTFIDRFRIEARVMADLEHPGIVRVSNFGEEQGKHYLEMDYVEGPDGAPRTLDDEVAWGKKMPEHVVLNLAIQLCDALAYAHTFPAGAIIHRDLKPGNILLQKPEQKTGPAPVPAPAGPAGAPDGRRRGRRRRGEREAGRVDERRARGPRQHPAAARRQSGLKAGARRRFCPWW